MSPSVVDYSVLTHLIHFSVIPNSDGTLNTSPNSLSLANSTNLVTRVHAAGKKVLICIGPEETAFVSAASSTNLSKFVTNIVNFMKARNYDGVDIDWEPISSSDAASFTSFITSLRTALNTISPRPLLTAAVATQPSLIGSLQTNFDQLNIMTYDLSGTYPGWVTWHNAPIFDGGYRFPSTHGLVPSCDGLVNTFTNAGVPLNKIGIGIAFYGYIWSGGDGTSTGGATQPRQSWTNAPTTSTASFNTIMSTYYQSNLYTWDTSAQAAYLSIDNSGSTNDKFISYDDEHTCQAKVSFARNRGLGGVMIWELGQGYRSSQPSGKRDPLLQAIKQALATPQISSVSTSNKNLLLSFTTAPLGSYHVQSTTNLNSITWTTLLTNSSSTGGVIQITDTNALAQPRRFYRVQTP